MKSTDRLKLINELKLTVDGREFQTLITRLAKKRPQSQNRNRNSGLSLESAVAGDISVSALKLGSLLKSTATT